MKLNLFVASFFCFSFLLWAINLHGQEEPEPVNSNTINELMAIRNWHQYTDAQNALYQYLSQQAFDLLQKRQATMQGVRTLEDWQKKQKETTKTFFDLVGPFPGKTPLNPRIIKTIKKEGFTLENIVFESQPGFYVTSSLFIPDGLKNGIKAPVIIYCSGHADNGYRGGYQRTILNLVKKNFIVFAYDPIGQGERLSYPYPKTGKSLVGSANREHMYPTAQTFITGCTLARYVIWDGIRAVDYLLTRPEIDPARIGMCGRSGGGFQSLYIPAFEPRIYATAPENHVTNYTRMLQSIGPRDGEQNIPHLFNHGIDHPDFLNVRAPKPTLLVLTTNDIFNIQGSLETNAEVSKIYKAYHKEDDFIVVDDIAGHSSTKKNNEAIYGFFQKYLDNPGSTDDEEVKILSSEELRVSPTGQVVTSYNSETVYSLNKKTSELLIKKLNTSRDSKDDHLTELVKMAKKVSGYVEPTGSNYPVMTGAVQRKGYIIRKYFIKGEGDYPVPYLLMVPEKSNNKAILYIHPTGKASEAKADGEMESFVKRGFTVLAPDMIGTGETGPGNWQAETYFRHAKNKNLNYQIWYASLLIGRSIVGIRAGDVNRLVGLLNEDLKFEEIYSIAKNEMCPVLLHAAAFNKSIKRIAILEPLASYRSMVYERFYNPGFVDNAVAGVLQYYDLPDLAASLAPRNLLMVNVTDATGKLSDTDDIRNDLSVIRKTYLKKNVENKLSIKTGDFSSYLDLFLK